MSVEMPSSLRGAMHILSCLDFRVDRLPLPRATKYWFLARLKQLQREGVLSVRHLTYLKPLGIRAAFGVKKDPVLARRLLEIPSGSLDNSDLEKLGIPLPYLVDLISVLSGGRVFVSWFIPPGIDPGPVLEWGAPGNTVSLGWKVPVQTCLPGIGRASMKEVREPTWDDVEVLGARLKTLLEAFGELKLRTPIVAYMLVALLDKYELLTLKEMTSITRVLDARDLGLELSPDSRASVLESSGKLKWRYVKKYYYLLSKSNVVGRVRILSRDRVMLPHAVLVAEPECAARVYGVMAVTGYAGHVYYSRNSIVTGFLLDSGLQHVLGSLSGECGLDSFLRYRTSAFPFPFELYHPLENTWYARPIPGYYSLLRRIGLTARG